MDNDLLLFSTTRQVIKAEEYCRTNSFDAKVIAVPKKISPECGMALALKQGEGEALLEFLLKIGIKAKLYSPAKPSFDLLTTVESGGCSAKIPADLLKGMIGKLPKPDNPNLLVGIDTYDDAAVYKLNDECAIIETTDFFPPVCSDPFEFGQIAAANALSDVFAMGGEVLTAMNIVMFPPEGIPFDVLEQILKGGFEKVKEAGGTTAGGHSISGYPPVYGLAVTGTVHPDKIVSNSQATEGQTLILTKPIGTGIIVAARRIGEATEEEYQAALDSMKQLNYESAKIMQKYQIKAATDITGFGLLGHALNIATSSNLQILIESNRVPQFNGVKALLESGCFTGAALRNLSNTESFCDFNSNVSHEIKVFLSDPQTSGGILMCVPPKSSDMIIEELKNVGYNNSAIIGKTMPLPSESNSYIKII